MNTFRVLIGCERSGIIRDAFAALGHNAWSCDLQNTEKPGPHYVSDVRDIMRIGWDLFIVHPDCRYLSVSGLHWNKRRPERAAKTAEALEFVRELLAAPIPHICLENPIGCISTVIRKPDQIIQPYYYGEDASKATCLWLKGLPLLQPAKYVEPRLVNGRPRWSNQTDSGQNRLGPSPTRAMDRARTYPGIAKAMAEQYSAALCINT